MNSPVDVYAVQFSLLTNFDQIVHARLGTAGMWDSLVVVLMCYVWKWYNHRHNDVGGGGTHQVFIFSVQRQTGNHETVLNLT